MITKFSHIPPIFLGKSSQYHVSKKSDFLLICQEYNTPILLLYSTFILFPFCWFLFCFCTEDMRKNSLLLITVMVTNQRMPHLWIQPKSRTVPREISWIFSQLTFHLFYFNLQLQIDMLTLSRNLLKRHR